MVVCRYYHLLHRPRYCQGRPLAAISSSLCGQNTKTYRLDPRSCYSLDIGYRLHVCLHMLANSRVLGQENSCEMPAKIPIHYPKCGEYFDRLGYLCVTSSSVMEYESLSLASTVADYALLSGLFVCASMDLPSLVRVHFGSGRSCSTTN